MKYLKDIIVHFKNELRVYQLGLLDPKTPRVAKCLLGFAVGYALMPFDIIPDFIPVLGLLDDMVIIPTIVMIAVRLVPKQVIADCRLKVKQGDNI